MSELDQRMYDALKAENEKLMGDIEIVKAKNNELIKEIKCLTILNRELEHNNQILKAQMEVVRMFLGKGDRDE